MRDGIAESACRVSRMTTRARRLGTCNCPSTHTHTLGTYERPSTPARTLGTYERPSTPARTLGIYDRPSPVGAGLLANAVGQLQRRCLKRRVRQQTGSYSGGVRVPIIMFPAALPQSNIRRSPEQ
jgi:hypothetical protein